MKKILLFCLSFLLTLTATAAEKDYGKYYLNLPKAMPQPTMPTIPNNQVSLTDFGAVPDGITLNTEAFHKAISKLTKLGGGHLIVPAGIYLTGPISLKDNIDIHLERNALILFSPNKKDFLKATDNEPQPKVVSGITASKRTNISITGEGTIDGNGQWWRPVKRVKMSDVEWNQYKAMGGTITPKGDLWYPFNLKTQENIAPNASEQEKMRAHLIRITECNNVLIQGVTIQNSPRFHIVPQRCNNVIVDGITVRCPWNAQNGDGIDVGNCSNVLIVNSTFDVGDDAICMKSGAEKADQTNRSCVNINIQNNTVYHGHGGFVIGSEVIGGMKNIYVNNNFFSGTDTGLRFKSAVGRGGKTEDIFINNCYMNNILNEAITFETTYWDNHVGATQPQKPAKDAEFVPNFQDIHITNVTCRGAKTAIAAHGAPGMVHDISIENSTFYYTDKATDIDSSCKITLKNIKFGAPTIMPQQ